EPSADLELEYELEASPASASGSIRLSATLFDRSGTPVHLDGNLIEIDEGVTRGTVTFPLRSDEVPGLALGLDGPLRLVSIDVAFPSVQDQPFTDTPLPSATYRLALGPTSVGERPVDLEADWRVG